MHWAGFLVTVVRATREVCGFFSSHCVLGIPLDWPVRFFFLGGLYLALRRWGRPRLAMTICVAILLLKEGCDVVGHEDLLRPRLPDWGDLADVVSGLAGLACAAWVARRWRRR